jgi:hypothetical protein
MSELARATNDPQSIQRRIPFGKQIALSHPSSRKTFADVHNSEALMEKELRC